MRIYRHVEDQSYHYYINHNAVTVLWYPDMKWEHKVGEDTKGKLLAQGKPEEVFSDLTDAVAPDLLTEIKTYYTANSNVLAEG